MCCACATRRSLEVVPLKQAPDARSAAWWISLQLPSTTGYGNAEAEQAAGTAQTEQEKDAELAQLRKENKQLKEANEILKLASAFSPRRSRAAHANNRGFPPHVPAPVFHRADVPGSTTINTRSHQQRTYRYQARLFGPTPVELRDAYDANRLVDIWTRNRRVYGRHKLWRAATRAFHR